MFAKQTEICQRRILQLMEKNTLNVTQYILVFGDIISLEQNRFLIDQIRSKFKNDFQHLTSIYTFKGALPRRFCCILAKTNQMFDKETFFFNAKSLLEHREEI